MTAPAIIAKITAQPGRRDELVAALQAMVDAVAEEPGTVQYVLHTDDGIAPQNTGPGDFPGGEIRGQLDKHNH